MLVRKLIGHAIIKSLSFYIFNTLNLLGCLVISANQQAELLPHLCIYFE
ncbi:hypothetical protein HMPREF0201_02315 [Cedecea davisae DSM 4568]|uniref:Uncharacterized protein n=1 Tax=Cedecea davisae DSM 4568 TaxID=566551 RepID=S3JTW9_9ENTR|nr:hypothetical protein HMPREF0201_02315 [Cedecea davisae DSM 4568]